MLKTLDTPVSDWSTQEVFDYVVNHLRTQGEKSLLKIGGCAYRGENNKKCAVGCLIPDKLYKLGMEGTTLKNNHFLSNQPELNFFLFGDHSTDQQTKKLELISELQKLHDFNAVDQWEIKFQKIAKDFNLIVPSKT